MLTAEEYKRAEFGFTVEESRRGVKIHAAVYTVVITGLIVLNALLWAYTDDGQFPWVVFPMIGWGIGLTFHYFYGYRHPEPQIRTRQLQVEEYAERTKQPV